MPSYSYSSSSTVSYSSTNRDGQTTGQAYQRTSESTPAGTTVRTTRQNMGEKPVTETQRYDASGRTIEGGGAGGAGSDRRIQDVSEVEGEEEESEADKLYRERMEDEYAKREGGA